jgi:hypothetical protein
MSSSAAESQLEQRGRDMKKTKATRGFWTWLMGGGWSGTGGGA